MSDRGRPRYSRAREYLEAFRARDVEVRRETYDDLMGRDA